MLMKSTVDDMKNRSSLHSLKGLLLFSALFVCLFPGLSHAIEDDETLGLLNAWQETSSTASRSPKPLSQTAENVTVVTAKDIEAINAHTLADVLVTIPGIALQDYSNPGGVVYTYVQGAQFNHVQVLMDGVPFNNLADNFPDIGKISVQQIDRIEIVKGAASSAWGQALGGVINVITKNPERDRKVSGSASASIGSRGTADTKAELSGTTGPVGYYLSGGYLGSGNLLPNTFLDSSNAYTKLTLALPERSNLTTTAFYARGNRGQFASDLFGIKGSDTARYLYTTLAYNRSISDGVDIEVGSRYTSNRFELNYDLLDNSATLKHLRGTESKVGSNAKIIWRTEHDVVVAGLDYEHAEFRNNNALMAVDVLSRKIDRWGAYFNDTHSFGAVSISSGARFDRTQTGGDQFSPSFGFTWQVSTNTLLRGYTALGHSLPPLAYDAKSERVWTSQLGIENNSTPIWLKGTLFRNQTWDILVRDAQGLPFTEKHIAMGGEVEARTVPVFHTSLSTGYTFIDTKRSNGTQVKEIPRHVLQLGLFYDDRILKGALTGRHVWWNGTGQFPFSSGHYYGLIWDLNLSANLHRTEHSAVELFFSAHNLFNNSQYLIEVYKNAGRWFEGGMRVRF